MTTQAQLDDLTPVIVGTGQYTHQYPADVQPPLLAPVELAARAARAALNDSGHAELVEQIDTIAITRFFTDSAPNWQSPFGSSNNPPESVARRIGAQPKERVYSKSGGSQPVNLLLEMAAAIARKERSIILLAGAEAIAVEKMAKRRGLEDNWNEEFDASMEDRGASFDLIDASEYLNGLHLPVHYYSLIENRQAFLRGHSIEQHRLFMARLFSKFSQIASHNPYSQFPFAKTSRELAQIDDDNYAITLPYSKHLVSRDAVNQSAALLLTSAGKAKALGIPRSHWICIQGYAEGEDGMLFRRPEPASSAAMTKVLQECLARAEITMDTIKHLDIYSCFPCAVTSVCEALSISVNDSRPLTVTGGMPYFGGPGNNYSMHALAEVCQRIRQDKKAGLVTANGGMLSQHAAVALAAADSLPEGKTFDWSKADTPPIREESAVQLSASDAPTRGHIVSYLLKYGRRQPTEAIVIAETPQGGRFIACSQEASISRQFANAHPINQEITVEQSSDKNLFQLVKM